MRGPYDDAESEVHRTVYSPYHESSEMCGTCHDLRNPLVNLRDENGDDTGLLFPEQISYTEWSQSDFAAEGTECQDCHMPSASGYVCTDLLVVRDHVPTHGFEGANFWMTSVLRALYGESLGRTEQYDRAINAALDMLQNRTAEVRLSAPWTLQGGTEAPIEVRVENLTGHKLPTGYPEGRRMWIRLEVLDGDGGTIWESGAYDESTGVLAADPDLKVYETIHGTHAGGPGFHLVLNDRIFLDNRIPPRGFVPDVETQPVGYEYPTLPDGSLAHWDVTPYTVPVPEGTPEPLRVTASLWYQTTTKEYVEFLRDENVTGPDPTDPDPEAPSRGEKMHALWEEHDRCPPVLVDSATRLIWIDREPPQKARYPDDRPAGITSLSQNPFRDRTEIRWSLPEPGPVTLAVYDVTGRRVATLAHGAKAAGSHTVTWDGRTDDGWGAASGTYWLRLEAPGRAPQVKRVVRLR
jgi:hypothetical protein